MKIKNPFYIVKKFYDNSSSPSSPSSPSSEILVNGSCLTIKDGVVYIDGVKQNCTLGTKQLVFNGNIDKLICDCSVTVYGSVGNINSRGSVSCDEVKGDVRCAGSVSCDDIYGSVNCGGSINADYIKDKGGEMNYGKTS